MACVLANMPEGGMTAAGKYWMADTEADLAQRGRHNGHTYDYMEGDLCYCRATKELKVHDGNGWTKLK